MALRAPWRRAERHLGPRPSGCSPGAPPRQAEQFRTTALIVYVPADGGASTSVHATARTDSVTPRVTDRSIAPSSHRLARGRAGVSRGLPQSLRLLVSRGTRAATDSRPPRFYVGASTTPPISSRIARLATPMLSPHGPIAVGSEGGSLRMDQRTPGDSEPSRTPRKRPKPWATLLVRLGRHRCRGSDHRPRPQRSRAPRSSAPNPS